MSSYYHCSPIQFNAGDLLVPAKGNKVVFMGDSPVPHKTIPHAYTWEWYVYEVEPQGTIWYGTDYWELMAASAVVLRCLGTTTELFRDREVSVVKLSEHPGAIPVTDCTYVGCDSPLEYMLVQAFDLYQQGEDGSCYPEYLDAAIRLIEGKEVVGDPAYYLKRFDPFKDPFFGPPG